MSKKGEMRLRDPVSGERLYLNKDERERFLTHTVEEKREYRVLCHVLHYTGCRITEALELSTDSILIEDRAIVFRTLKQREFDADGNLKPIKKRVVDIPSRLIEDLDLVFNIRHIQKIKSPASSLWTISRTTGWRAVTRVLGKAGIKGQKASPKGFRHGFGVAMIQSGMALPVLSKLLGHSSLEVTAIYTQVEGEERRGMVMKAWE